jgi:hypothetical protein
VAFPDRGNLEEIIGLRGTQIEENVLRALFALEMF